MPSGVSHGSALPAGAAAVAFSNAISAKFGMRLMALLYHARSDVVAVSIMVRMLVADDGGHLLRPVILLRGLARKVRNADHPAEAGFGAELPGRDHPVGPVEGTGHDLDPGAVDAAEAQGRAAGRAEVAHGD